DGAGVRALQARQDRHQRRLAGAVLAHHRRHDAAADVDRHVVERHDAREVLAEPGDADRRAQRSVGHPSGVTVPALSALTTSGGISTFTGSAPSATRSRSWVIDVTTWPTGSWLIEKAIVPSSMYVSVCCRASVPTITMSPARSACSAHLAAPTMLQQSTEAMAIASGLACIAFWIALNIWPGSMPVLIGPTNS